MSNYLDDYMFSDDKKGRKPTILLNIGDDDVTRGDTAGRKGLAKAFAKKIGGVVLYSDERTLDDLYPDGENLDDDYKHSIIRIKKYSKLLKQYISEHRSPDIMIGRPCNAVLEEMGKHEEHMLYVTNVNERLSADHLKEDKIVAHHLTDEMLEKEGKKFDDAYSDLTKPIIALFLVNPESFMQDAFVEKIASISKKYKEATIFLCGSRRTKDDRYAELKQKLEQNVKKSIKITGFQFDRDAKFNPYRGLIARSDHFILWGNSMSMMSEPLITGKTVHLYSYGTIDRNHIKKNYVTDFNKISKRKPLPTKHFAPVNVTEELADKLIDELKKQNEALIKTKEGTYKEKGYPKEWYEELVKICVNPHYIEDIAESLQQNPNFIKAALEENGMAFQHLSKEQQNDPELIKISAISNINALEFANESIFDNSDTMFHILKTLHDNDLNETYQECSDRLKSCPNFNLDLLKADTDVRYLMDENLLENYDIALNILKIFAGYKLDLPQKFLDDPIFLKKAFDKNVLVYQYLQKKEQGKTEYLDALIEREASSLIRYAPHDISDQEDIMIRFIKEESNNFSYASQRLKKDKEFIIRCAALPNFSICKISENLYSNQDFVRKITKAKPEWRKAPELTKALRLIRYKDNLSSIFNTVTSPIKTIANFKNKFKPKQKLKP